MSSFVSCDGDVNSPSLISDVAGSGIGGGAPRCTVECLWTTPVVHKRAQPLAARP